MNFLLIIILGGLAFLLFINKNKKKPIKHEPSLFNENAGQIKAITEQSDDTSTSDKKIYKYRKIERIVSPAERSFLGVLNAVLDDEVLILTKVRVADVLTPIPTQNRSIWQRAFNSISSKHFDFVLCKSDDLSIICTIALNDKSHSEADRQERDEFLRDACSGADLPLVEIQAKSGYMLQEVADLLKPYISTLNVIPEAINCDKCGSPMVLRTTKRGENTGKQFYGCSNYPSCRHIKDYQSQVN